MPDSEYSMKVVGLGKLNRDLKKISKDLSKETQGKIRKIAKDVRATGRTLAPVADVDGGDLRRSLRVSVRARSAAVVSNSPYAGVHEYGGTISPRGVPIEIGRSRFLGRAVFQHAKDIEDQMGNLLDSIATRNGFH